MDGVNGTWAGGGGAGGSSGKSDILAAAAAAAGRQLQQLATKPDKATCLANFQHCIGCVYRTKGNTTKLYCTNCEVNYKLVFLNATASCKFSPVCGSGTYFDATANGCVPCGYSFYCPASIGGVTTRTACASNNTGTRGQYARGPWDCMALSGYGWLRSANEEGATTPCPVGTFNPLRYTQWPTFSLLPGSLPHGCRRCPGNLTTAGVGAKSTMECLAPPGYYYELGKALPCPEGSFKVLAGNYDCTGCQDGLYTVLAGSVLPSSCNVILAGYMAAANGSVDPCPIGSYNPGGQLWQGPGTTVNCTKCPSGMATDSDGSTTEDACQVAPGFGYNSTSGSAYLCPAGTFGRGWNAAPCTPCGKNILTDGTGSTVPDDCYIQPGYGSSQWDGVWTSFPCPVDTFGLDQPSPGLVRVECLGCMEFTSTYNMTGATDDSFCLTLPGWGYYNELVRPCMVGEWSAGVSRQPCTACPTLFTTTGFTSTSASDCKLQQGYTADSEGRLTPCPIGTYKDAIGTQPCTRCPNGTTTSKQASNELGDCGLCRAGFGSESINMADPSCTLCTPGTYNSDGMRCLPCSTLGTMTSPWGSQSYDMCVYVFMLPGSSTGNHFDLVAMAPAALAASATSNTLTACQDECDAAADDANGCQYLEFRSYEVLGQRCWLRKLGVKPPANSTAADGVAKVFFHIKNNVFTVYPAHSTDWASLGVPVVNAVQFHATLASANAECERAASCGGYKYSAAGGAAPWALFAGSLSATVTSRMRVYGTAINPWVAPPVA